jgi:hypothetical protein
MRRLVWLLLTLSLIAGCAGTPSPATQKTPPQSPITTPAQVPEFLEVDYGERLVRKDDKGLQVYFLSSPARIRVSVNNAQSVEAHLFEPVGDFQDPLLVVPFTATDPSTWVGDLELQPDRTFHLEILAELKPNTPDQTGSWYLRRNGKRWRFLSGIFVSRAVE